MLIFLSHSQICCDLNDPNCLKMEIVSPVLQGRAGLEKGFVFCGCFFPFFFFFLNSFKQIEAMMGILSVLNVSVNESTGFHVHVGSNPFFSLEELKRICANFVKYENAFDSVCAESRRGVNNKYCKSHQHMFGLQSNKNINDVILSRVKLNGLLDVMNRRDDRYFKLNLQRVSEQSPTIEFRQHNGTGNFEKVRAWILLLLHFVKNSRELPRPDNFAMERTPSYQRQRMFQWIVREPILARYYESRAQQLETGPNYWKCACGKAFPFCQRLVQHQQKTGHSNPSCCAKCANH